MKSGCVAEEEKNHDLSKVEFLSKSSPLQVEMVTMSPGFQKSGKEEEN